MSRESEVTALLEANTNLTAILTGGIYPYEETGIDGITRELCPDAFDAAGFLLPCALVKQRGDVADGTVRITTTKQVSSNQVVEVWLYQDKGSFAAIDAARPQIRFSLEGELVSDSFPLEEVFHLSRQHDTGALNGASMERVDFAVNGVNAPV